MDFAQSEEHEAFRKVVREFADAEIAPYAEEWDRTHEFPADTVRKMGDLGLFGLPFSEKYGGSGADFTTLCIAIEEIARVDQSVALTLEATRSYPMPSRNGGSPIWSQDKPSPDSGSPRPNRVQTPAGPGRPPSSTVMSG